MSLSTYIYIGLIAGLVMYSAIGIHELGHLSYFKYVLGKEVNLNWFSNGGGTILVGTAKDYVGLSKWDKFGIYASGILSGLVFIIALGLLFDKRILWLALLYLYPCWVDFRNIWRLCYG